MLEYVAIETLEQMQKSQGMITEKEEKGLRDLENITKEDKARKDFAVSVVSNVSRTTFLAG